MKYVEIRPISLEEAKIMLSSENPEQVREALLGAVESVDDWHWLQEKCMRLVDSDDVWTARTAITCLGHIARIFGELDKEKVLNKLALLKANPDLTGHIESAENDIKLFLGDC